MIGIRATSAELCLDFFAIEQTIEMTAEQGLQFAAAIEQAIGQARAHEQEVAQDAAGE